MNITLDTLTIQLQYIVCFNRNICNLPTPTNGWGKQVDQHDTLLSDDIERIRILRNEVYSHTAQSEMSDAEFKSIWIKFEEISIRMETHMPGNSYRTVPIFYAFPELNLY